MKKAATVLIILILTISVLYFEHSNLIRRQSYRDSAESTSKTSDVSTPSRRILPTVPQRGPDCEVYYFSTWHVPYESNVIDRETMRMIWEEISKLPSEQDKQGNQKWNKSHASVGWTCMGPYGQRVRGVPTESYYSGRVLDIEIDNGDWPRFAAASGGLWAWWWGIPYSLSDYINSLAIGAFTSKPGDPNTILVGTGEFWQRGGTGLWMTTDKGSSWTNIPMDPEPDAFFKIRYTSTSSDKIYIACSHGFYRSTDGGVTFQRELTGTISDFVMVPGDPTTLYAARWAAGADGGLFVSYDSGDNWSKLTSPGLPTSNVGRTSLSIYDSETMYVSMAKADDHSMLGVFKTEDVAASFSDISPSENVLGGQGWYDNVISVCPLYPDIVLLGGIDLWRTTDGGSNWNKITSADVHADQHVIRWSGQGNLVHLGNDGGLTVSTDYGSTWSTKLNWFPITQYVNIDIDPLGKIIFGGSQDNGISGSLDYGIHWIHYLGGDGGGIAIDSDDPSKICCTLGVYGGDWAFKRHKTTDSGSTWGDINTGIPPSAQWYHKIRNDKVPPINLYCNSGSHVYYSTDEGANWNQLNTTAFPTDELYNMTVARDGGSSITSTPVYGCLAHQPGGADHSGQQLRVYDDGSWEERSTGFPSRSWIRTVAIHPYNTNTIYALMTGLISGQKVFKSTDRGKHWTNISGDLPNVPTGDLEPHPTNDDILYLGTEMGCYKTTDGGVHWMRWNMGMPEANIVTEMSMIDSIDVAGKYYIVAGTYGRSVWIRDISSQDTITAIPREPSIPHSYALKQNVPNPFNSTTTIRFILPSPVHVELKVYDITGREVAELVNGRLVEGVHNVDFDATSLSSGIYIYRLKTSKFVASKKMMYVK